MKKHILITLLVVFLAAFGYLISLPVGYLNKDRAQWIACRTVLDGLNSDSIKGWEARSLMLWGKLKSYSEYDIYGMGELPVPQELDEMKIRKVVVSIDSIDYKWVTGMSSCSLFVERKEDGYMYFYARYDDDYEREVFKIPMKPKFSRTRYINAR